MTRPPRWYQHARIKRYGRTLYVNTPRVWKWGLSLVVYTASTFGLGVIAFHDHDDDEWVLLVVLVAVEFRITRMRYLTKREIADRHEALAEQYGPQLAAEAEAFLRGDG